MNILLPVKNARHHGFAEIEKRRISEFETCRVRLIVWNNGKMLGRVPDFRSMNRLQRLRRAVRDYLYMG